MTPQQALEQLLAAARLAPLTYQQHAACDAAAKVLQEVLSKENAVATAEPGTA